MKAWATLLTGPGYLVGVTTLKSSLEQVGSAYPLVVMVTEDVDAPTREALGAAGCEVRDVEVLSPPKTLKDDYAIARFAQNWNKLIAWSLTEYERVVFLDADMLVVAPMDELFELDLPADHMAAGHACRCNPERNPTYPADWVPANCFFTYARGAEDAERPELVENHMNSGLMVLTPSQEIFEDMARTVRGLEDISRYAFAEQDFLDERFEGRWRPLPYVYNALKTLPVRHPALWEDGEVKNIHFVLDKPWDAEPDPDSPFAALERRWWDVAGRGGTQPRA